MNLVHTLEQLSQQPPCDPDLLCYLNKILDPTGCHSAVPILDIGDSYTIHRVYGGVGRLERTDLRHNRTILLSITYPHQGHPGLVDINVHPKTPKLIRDTIRWFFDHETFQTVETSPYKLLLRY